MSRRNMSLCVLAFTSMLTLAGCQKAPAPEPKKDVAADTSAINTLRDQVAAAFNAHDPAAMAATYADDAIEMNPDEPAIEGRQAIQAAYEAMFKEMPGKLAFSPLETQVAGDWAYDRGNYTATMTRSLANRRSYPTSTSSS